MPPKNKKRCQRVDKKKKKTGSTANADGEAKIDKWFKDKFPHKPYEVVVFDRMIYDKLSKEVLDYKLVVRAELWCLSVTEDLLLPGQNSLAELKIKDS